MVGERAYGWEWFHTNLAEMARLQAGDLKSLLSVVQGCDRFVSAFVDRPHGLDGDRPHDYMACQLLAKAHRLTISGVWVSVSGYPDVAPILARTMWEMAIRLFYAKPEPVAAALGYYLHCSTEIIAMMEAEMAHRGQTGEPLFNLEVNRDRERSHHDDLAAFATRRGLDPGELKRRYGRLNFKRVCKEMGVDTAYAVTYAFESGHVHERGVTRTDFVYETTEGRQYDLGTVAADIDAAALDVLQRFLLVAAAAAELAEEETFISLASELSKALEGSKEDGGVG